jgi:uncharacterized iron-regulated membrane protein
MPADMKQAMKFHNGFDSLHFGKWAGLFSRFLYFLAALIGATLPWSGYYLWWKLKHNKAIAKNKQNSVMD